MRDKTRAILLTIVAGGIAIGTLHASPAFAAARSETAVLAGGCFWGTEAVFEHVRGVRNVVSGYAGGMRKGVGNRAGQKGDFAEAVRISYDPAVISYDRLLEIFVRVAHDPTQVNRQGPDVGRRYRSAIFPQNSEQRAAAQRFLAQLRASRQYPRPIATKIESGPFSLAEPGHQDYMRKHPNVRYVVVNDRPKLAALKRQYPQLWRE